MITKVQQATLREFSWKGSAYESGNVYVAWKLYDRAIVDT